MGENKLKIHNTEIDNLISNLRGEVGEIILTWKIYLRLIKNIRFLTTNDLQKDLSNPDIVLLEILIDKLENEIISRLSELAEQKIGQLIFYFAQKKLEKTVDISSDVSEYKKFVEKERFSEKRNQSISHKQLPEKWTEHKIIIISKENIGKCLSLAVKLMIKIDKVFLGPSTIYLWREVLKKKTAPLLPLSGNYLLLPHMYLDKEIRGIIIRKEMNAGIPVWESVKMKVNGFERNVAIYKKWGAILLRPNEMMLIDPYPIQELTEINFDLPNG